MSGICFLQRVRDMTYDERVTDFFESYLDIPKKPYYYIAGKVLKRETYKEFVSHLLEERVFEDYEDIRIAALMEYDVVLPAKT